MSEDNLLTTDVPEKFKDAETGAVRMDDFVKSYREMEKQFSQRPAAPKTPDDYCVECQHGLFEVDPHVNQRLHGLGLSQEQVQAVYDLAAEVLVPKIAEISADFEADRQVEKLINHFGGAEQWKAVSKQLLAFGQRALPAEVLESMTGSYEGVLALHRMMVSQEPTLSATSDVAVSAQGIDEQELKKMMKDPRYWRDRDPAFVKQVTEGFQSHYSG